MPTAQWAALDNILTEAETAQRDPAPCIAPHPGRPRRILRPRSVLTLRRERTRDGWSLHFTGPQAKGKMIDSVMDAIERMYGPGVRGATSKLLKMTDHSIWAIPSRGRTAM
jgi:ParB family chromosome partitioning protein